MAHLEIIISLVSFAGLIGSWFALPAETRAPVLSLAVTEAAASAA